MGKISTEGSNPAELPPDYRSWLTSLKHRIQSAQQRAALAVNRELVLLYWQIGRDILARQGWGAKVIERLAHDLRTALPEMKGFSRANLMYMRPFRPGPMRKLSNRLLDNFPGGHNLVLLARLKDPRQRLAYAQSAIKNEWSRNVLNIHIQTRLLERSGTAVANFDARLPRPQSDLARESLIDPYRLDFLGLANGSGEREIENALVKHLTEFLLELGAGFALVGRQVLLDVGGDGRYVQ